MKVSECEKKKISQNEDISLTVQCYVVNMA